MCSNPEHGQLFDNRNRWCANCNKTVTPQQLTCSECSAIWPEHVEEYLESIEGTSAYQQFTGVGLTWH